MVYCDRSTNNAPVYPLLLRHFLHFSTRERSIWVDNCFWIILSNTLKTVGNILTGLQFWLALGRSFYREVLYQLILNFEKSTVSLKFGIPYFWSTLFEISKDFLSTLVGIFPKALAFIEIKRHSSFVILDTLISVKRNKD